MKLVRCADYEQMSKAAAECVTGVLARKRDAVLCAATGSSPTALYRELAHASRMDPGLFAAVRIVKLDEWLGVSPEHPASCEHYLRNKVVEPLRVSSERYLAFRSDASDPIQECTRVQTELDRRGIDVCILGLGTNGHVGLNEPAPSLEIGCHVARLTDETRGHGLLADLDPKPTHGLTVGIGDMLRSRKIVLLITGRGKEGAFAELLSGKLTTAAPVSLLALHDDLDVFVDESSVTSGS